MKYATFNNNGVLSARLISGVHAIPAGAIKIDEKLWGRMISETDGVWTLGADGAITKQSFPPPTVEQILSSNTEKLNFLLAQASQTMTPLLVSLQLGGATAEETTAAKAWRAYCRELKLVDLNVAKPAWPAIPS